MTQYTINDVFISYRRKESDCREQGTQIAEKIYEYLTQKGSHVFLDVPRMENGPFTEQLHWQVCHAPNYVFIATKNAMEFKPSPEPDYVAEEVRLALKLYEENPDDRLLLVVKPKDAPYPKETDESVPIEIRKLFKHRVLEMTADEILSNDEKVLKDVLENVTEVKRRNLWNAGYHWLTQVTQQGGRFASFNFDETIMPLATEKRAQDIRLPIRAHLEENSDVPLMDLIRDTLGHLYLIGEGGIGKTTALFSIMNHVYGSGQNEKDIERNRMNGQVPLFIELSKAPDTYGRLYEGGRSTFIQRAVYQQIRTDLKVKQVSRASVEDVQEVFNLDPETAVKPIHDLFTRNAPVPEYLLLLDGLNEVSRTEIGYTILDGDGTTRSGRKSVVSMVVQEIRDLMTDCPNVRVILTSRSKEQSSLGEKTTMLYLSGVRDATIESYLRDKNVPDERIEAVKRNEKLREVLRIPLFLTLYASLESNAEILTRGEILRLFFHQKMEKMYTIKARSEAVDLDVKRAASAEQPDRLTAPMQTFILDFILPEIAWCMVRDGEFYIRRADRGKREGLRSIIWRVLNDRSETSICGENGKNAFIEYRQISDRSNTRKIAKELCKRLRDDEDDEEDALDEIVEGILVSAEMTLGVLQGRSEGNNDIEYGFIHHHIRDYFAAVHQINNLKLAVFLQENEEGDTARRCLADWKAQPLPLEVRRFIGEALGEMHNQPTYCSDKEKWCYTVPDYPCERSLLKRTLDVFRNRFEDEDDYAVWNIIDILARTRGDLSGEDFSNLDLSKCRMNGITFGRNGCHAIFSHSILHDEFFMPYGNSYGIIDACFSPDDKYVITVSYNDVVVWDIDLMKEIGRIDIKDRHFYSAAFCCNGKHILVSNERNTIVYEFDSFVQINQIDGQIAFCSPDNAYIVTICNGKSLKLWDCDYKIVADLGELKKEISFPNTPSSRWFAFSKDSRLFMIEWDEVDTSYQTIHHYQIWDLFSHVEIPASDNYDFVAPQNYSPDESLCAEFDENLNIVIYKTQCSDVFTTIKTNFASVSTHFVLFSHRKNWILYTSGDNRAVIFDIQRETRIAELRGYSELIDAATFSPDAHTIFVASRFEPIYKYSVDGHCFITSFDYDSVNVTDIECIGDNTFVTSSSNGSVHVWDSIQQKQKATLCKQGRFAFGIVSSKKYVFVQRFVEDFEFRIPHQYWDVRSFQECTLPTELLEPRVIAFSPDERHMFIADDYGSFVYFDREVPPCQVWDLETMTYRNVDCLADSASYNHDGTILAISNETDETGAIILYETKRYTIVNFIDEHAFSVVFSPTNTNMISLSSCNSHDTKSKKTIIELWDVKDLHSASKILTKTMNEKVKYLSYSNDGTLLLVVHRTGAEILDAYSLECVDAIRFIPGLRIFGCDLRQLHPKTLITKRAKRLLKQFGAIIDVT